MNVFSQMVKCHMAENKAIILRLVNMVSLVAKFAKYPVFPDKILQKRKMLKKFL